MPTPLLLLLTVTLSTVQSDLVCPSPSLPPAWLTNLMYCGWEHAFGTVFTVDTLAACLLGLPDNAIDNVEPMRDESLAAEFSGIHRTICAETCVLLTAQNLQEEYSSDRLLLNCNVTDMDWNTLLSTVDTELCVGANYTSQATYTTCVLADVTTPPPPTYSCPSQTMDTRWLPALIYCAWSRVADVEFDSISLASCLRRLPQVARSDETRPVRPVDLLAQFEPRPTDCASHCIVDAANYIHAQYMQTDGYRDACGGSDWSSRSLNGYIDNSLCTDVAIDVYNTYSQCADTSSTTTKSSALTAPSTVFGVATLALVYFISH